MKNFYVLILAIIVMATALPQLGFQIDRGGGLRMGRNGMEGMRRLGRDMDRMVEIHAAGSYEDELEQMRGLREVMEEDLEVEPDFERSRGRNLRNKDLGVIFDE